MIHPNWFELQLPRDAREMRHKKKRGCLACRATFACLSIQRHRFCVNSVVSPLTSSLHDNDVIWRRLIDRQKQELVRGTSVIDRARQWRVLGNSTEKRTRRPCCNMPSRWNEASIAHQAVSLFMTLCKLYERTRLVKKQSKRRQCS